MRNMKSYMMNKAFFLFREIIKPACFSTVQLVISFVVRKDKGLSRLTEILRQSKPGYQYALNI